MDSTRPNGAAQGPKLHDIVVYRLVLARIAGSATAGLFMSQAFYWYDKVKRPFYKPHHEWTDETCLTVKQQRVARAKWRQLGVLKEQLRGHPAKLWYELDISRLDELIAADEQAQARRNPTVGPKGQTGRPKGQTSSAERANTTSLTSSLTFITSDLQSASGQMPDVITVDFGADNDAAFLRKTESFLRAGSDRPEIGTLRDWHARCEQIADNHDPGHPLGGRAYRLGDDLHGIIRASEDSAPEPTDSVPPVFRDPEMGRIVVEAIEVGFRAGSVTPRWLADALVQEHPDLPWPVGLVGQINEYLRNGRTP